MGPKSLHPAGNVGFDGHEAQILPPRFYIQTLDGWRAIAIGFVVAAHSAPSIFQSFGMSADQATDEKLGLLGVHIFFALSGFLITSRLLHEELQTEEVSLYSFYIRRAFRILPAAIFVLLVAGALSTFDIISLTFGRWLSALLFFANYSNAQTSYHVGHFWSLAVEEHFYIFWPALFIVLASTKRRVSTAVSASIVIAVWRMVDWKYRITNDMSDKFFSRTDVMGDTLLWGVTVALLAADPLWGPRLRSAVSPRFVFPILCLAVASLSLAPPGGWKTGFLLMTLQHAAIPLVIFCTVATPNRLPGRVLESKIPMLIGRLSYSIYLWQQLFLTPAPSSNWLGELQRVPFNFVAVIICSVMSYRLIERPMIRVGHSITRRLPARSRSINPGRSDSKAKSGL
jgi:peptidoglycan/LPS O-acetylase OafA/YrhL